MIGKNIFPKKKRELIKYSEHPMSISRLDSEAPTTTMPEEKGVETSTRLVNPRYLFTMGKIEGFGNDRHGVI